MLVQYISVWDGGIEVNTKADFDPITKVVSNVELSEDVDGLDNLEKEYIVTPNGEYYHRRYDNEVDDGKSFTLK